jgi:hypothetical protein
MIQVTGGIAKEIYYKNRGSGTWGLLFDSYIGTD